MREDLLRLGSGAALRRRERKGLNIKRSKSKNTGASIMSSGT